MKRRVVIALFVVAFAVACCVDARVANAVRSSGLAGKVRGSGWAEAVKFFGTFWYAVVAAGGVLVLQWFTRRPQSYPVVSSANEGDLDSVAKTQAGTGGVLEYGRPLSRQSPWRAPVSVILAAAFSGLNVIPKWIIGQIRPFKPDGITVARPFDVHWFWHGISGLFHESDLSFPSGHASISGAVAAAVSLVCPKATPLVIAIALVVGIERVIENAHYTDDVIAGWALGWGAAIAARWIVGPRRGLAG